MGVAADEEQSPSSSYFFTGVSSFSFNVLLGTVYNKTIGNIVGAVIWVMDTRW